MNRPETFTRRCEGCGAPNPTHQAPPPYRPFLICDECVVPFAKAVRRFEKKTRPRLMATKLKRRRK